MIQAEESDLRTRARARVGRVLRGKYRLDHLLGVGGMGSVYAATHLHNADRVAVKILHRELSVDAGLRARFQREGDAANRVEHAGTVRVLDDDIAEDGSLFIVMDLLDGETLDARWRRRGQRLGAREVVKVICEVLDVLGAAHAKGIVHRDLKPENLFLTRDGKVKVLDFGLARPRGGSPTETKTGTWFGTPAFMGPEQALGKTSEVDALSDLWAVGATAFLLLTGRVVHQGNTTQETLVLSATQSAPPIASVVHDVPPIIANVVDRALTFSKAGRWPSAGAMRDALVNAGRVVWGRDGPEDLENVEDRGEEKTDPAPPPQMTLQNGVARPMSFSHEYALEAPTLRTSSFVAGIESRSQPARVRRRLGVVSVVVCAIGVAIAVAVTAAAPASSKHQTQSAAEPPRTSPPAGDSTVRTSSAWTVNGPAPPPSAVDVETLPLTPSDHSRTHR
jgi:serine/threonine protein kinase